MIWKKILPVLPVMLLLTGCNATFTRLTPLQQQRNPDNLYHVEVAFHSQQQSLRWDSLKPYVMVNGQLYDMHAVPKVPNRWEGYIRVPPDSNSINFRFKFDYLYNDFGKPPQPDSASSPNYTLRVKD